MARELVMAPRLRPMRGLLPGRGRGDVGGALIITVIYPANRQNYGTGKRKQEATRAQPMALGVN